MIIVQHTPSSPTSGIQEAVDQASGSGDIVLIPSGQYLVRRAIILKSGVQIVGEGNTTELIRQEPFSTYLLDNSSQNPLRLTLKSPNLLQPGDQLWMTQKDSYGYLAHSYVIKELKGQHIYCEYLQGGEPEKIFEVDKGAWTGNYYSCFYGKDLNGVQIEKLKIYGGDFDYSQYKIPDWSCAAISLDYCEKSLIQDVTVSYWPSDGISCGSGSAKVMSCTIEDCLGNGLHPGNKLSQSIWKNNISIRNKNGFFFCYGVKNAIVDGNIFKDNQHNGVWGLGHPDRNNLICNNIISDNGYFGIEAKNSDSNIISHNIIQNNSKRKPGHFAGVHLSDHKNTFIGQNVYDDADTSTSQKKNIEITNPLSGNRNEDGPFVEESSYQDIWEEWEENEKREQERLDKMRQTRSKD